MKSRSRHGLSLAFPLEGVAFDAMAKLLVQTYYVLRFNGSYVEAVQCLQHNTTQTDDGGEASTNSQDNPLVGSETDGRSSISTSDCGRGSTDSR